jgi:hypothetical protein
MPQKLALGQTAPTTADTRLLVAALGPEAVAERAWHEWRRTTSVEDSPTRLHALLPLVSARLPDDVLGGDAAKLRGLRRRSWAVGERLKARLATVRAVLDDVGAGPRAVRGSVFLDDPGPLDRPVDRLDVLVHPAAWAEALAALTADGWRAALPRSRSEAGITLEDATGTRLRVTWAPAFPGLLRRPLPEVSVGEPPGRLLVSLLEGLRPPGYAPLLWPADVDALTRAFGPEDWSELVLLAEQARVSPVVGAALCWCQRELGARYPEAVTSSLTSGRLDPSLSRRFAAYAAGRTTPDQVRRRLDIRRAAAPYGIDLDLGAPRQNVGRRARNLIRRPASGAGPARP